MEPRIMPSTIDYGRMLPLSIPAMASRRKFFPSNGSTFSRQGNRQVRIEIGHPSALLDATHSYLEVRLSNVGAQTFGLDLGGTNCIFENIRVEQGGKLLSYTQASNRLHSAILAPVQTSSEGLSSEGCTEGGRSYNDGAAQSVAPAAVGGNGEIYDVSVHNTNAFHANGTNHRLTMGITSGLFSQDKLIPLPLVNPNAPITLVLDMGAPADAGCWNGVPGAADLVISEISYIAHMIEVGPDVIDQFRMVQREMGGQLALSGQDYEYFSQAVPAATAGQAALSCPARKRSIKSLYWCAQSSSVANAAIANLAVAFNLSYAGNMNVASWQYQVGPILYPAGEPVRCWGITTGAGAVGAEFNRSQCAMELAKSVGTMARTNPTGILNTLSYGTSIAAARALSDGDNGVGAADMIPTTGTKYCVCPFGLSVDSFARDVVESGVDTQTLAQETRLLLNWDAGANSGAEDKIVHMWALFDQHYYFNANGMITFSN